MDYHLDWIQMAIWLAAKQPDLAVTGRVLLDDIPNDGLVCGTQQDIDLLLAFEIDATTHLVMIEAKGTTYWRNRQLKQKVERLTCIFGDKRPDAGPVVPHFVLMSPECPRAINTCGWPSWTMPNGKPLWLRLALPPNLIKVVRYDPENAAQHERYRLLRIERS